MKRNLIFLFLVLAALVLPLQLLDSSQAASQERGRQKLQRDPDSAPSYNYLSPGKRHKLQVSDPEAIRELEKHGGRVIADYGEYKLLDVDTDAASELANIPGLEIRDEYNLVLLNSKVLDTTDGEITEKLHEEKSPGRHMHIVQFAGPIKPEWYNSLLETGVEIVTYIPNNAYLVYGNRGSLRRLRRMTESATVVQWEGDYKEEYKVSPDLSREKAGDLRAQGEESELVAIQLVEDKGENPATIQLINGLKTDEIFSQWDILKYKNFIVPLSPGKSKALAARPDVVYVAPYVVPKIRDERQNIIMTGNLTSNAPTPSDYLAYLAGKGFTQAQFTTSGFSVDVGDDGLDNATTTPNHPGLHIAGVIGVGSSRVVYARKEGAGSGPEIRGCDGHGTLNTHIVGGFVPFAFGSGFPHADSAGFRYGMGVCPFVRVGSSVVFSPGFTSPNFPNWQSRAYNDGSRISTNSWGASVGGAYTLDAQSFDALVRDAAPGTSAIPVAGNQEMVILFAAGNDGPGAQTVGAPGTAKNVITVGAAENVHSHSTANGGNSAAGTDGCGLGDTGADNANDMASFSSRGPCTDQRKKPEIVAPGTHVTGGVFQAAGALPANGMADACFDSGSVCALPGSGTAGDPDNFFPLGQQWYTTSTGTSHSTPAVAGAAALVRQHFINQSLTPPSPAMTKGVLMNSARYMNGAGANDTLWSNSQGMGEVVYHC